MSSIAFADLWACDEEGARALAAEAATEGAGNLRETLRILGVRYSTAVFGEQRRKPWAEHVRAEARRVRDLRRPFFGKSETRVSDTRGMMGGR
jgi:hypothetical protein